MAKLIVPLAPIISTCIDSGSPLWVAPEIIRGDTYDERCDVFSFGIMVWEVCSRQLPYPEARKSKKVLTKIQEVGSGQARPEIPMYV